MVAASTVSPAEISNWASQRSSAKQNMLGTQAGSLYGRQMAGIDYGKSVRDFTKNAQNTRMGLPGAYQKRGLAQSGLYKHALENYAMDRQQGLGDLAMQYQGQIGQFVQGDRGAGDAYAQALQRIAAEQYARQAQQASQVGGWL